MLFFGHRKIKVTEELIEKLSLIIEHKIINDNIQLFLFGSKSSFNDLCLKVVNNLKEIYSNIKTIYVRAEYPYIDKSYTEQLLKYYNDTYFLEKLLKAGSLIYVERNYHMIDKSNYCIFTMIKTMNR